MKYPKLHPHNEDDCPYCEVYADVLLDLSAENEKLKEANYKLQVESDRKKYEKHIDSDSVVRAKPRNS